MARGMVLDPRKSGLGARGGAIRVPVGCVDVRLFGGSGEEDEIPSGRGPAAISGEGTLQPRNSPRPDGRSCCFGMHRPVSKLPVRRIPKQPGANALGCCWLRRGRDLVGGFGLYQNLLNLVDLEEIAIPVYANL